MNNPSSLSMNPPRHALKLGSPWRLTVFLLVLGTALGAHAGPPSSTVPGPKPDSTEPWGNFLGRAAHDAIGRQYQAEHPKHTVFINSVSLRDIVKLTKLGDTQRFSEYTGGLRPDITDVDDRVLFEIKPDTEAERAEGRTRRGAT